MVTCEAYAPSQTRARQGLKIRSQCQTSRRTAKIGKPAAAVIANHRIAAPLLRGFGTRYIDTNKPSAYAPSAALTAALASGDELDLSIAPGPGWPGMPSPKMVAHRYAAPRAAAMRPKAWRERHGRSKVAVPRLHHESHACPGTHWGHFANPDRPRERGKPRIEGLSQRAREDSNL